MIQSPPAIELLPEHLIDQIKAGEVIERPGNLIKEILENSVDAGSTKLELTIKNNGLDLISLKDNGHGMKYSDLPLAFSRHATSKISRFEDLYRLRSFGFRGEALASIAAISKLQCISKNLKSTTASELRIEGGEVKFHGERQTIPFEHGTELVIQDLFYNTPARLKFIQSQQAEKTFIKKIIFAFILSHPKIEFQVKIDENEKEIYSSQLELGNRISDLFPKAQNSIMFSQKFYEDNELEIFLIPGTIKAPIKIQYIYINDRFVLDKQLHRVMSNGLAAAFGQDDFHYVAHFSLPPDSIDVNVHPNKTIIKVMEMSKLIGLLSSTIKDLASKQNYSKNLAQAQDSKISYQPNELLIEGSTDRELPQERHHYNMEGFFSPHRIPENEGDDFVWIDSSFLKKMGHTFFVFSAHKLLEHYTRNKMNSVSSSIPLLVSEPFSSRDVSLEHIRLLNESGMELEFLGKETIVVRSIPDWMNGFPLRPVIQCLINKESFSTINIISSDWSQSTWDEMLSSFPIDELITEKIALNLSHLLKEKFK
jgi:DNA mismatch repair protein MutL